MSITLLLALTPYVKVDLLLYEGCRYFSSRSPLLSFVQFMI